MKFGFVTCVQLGVACAEEIYRAGGKLAVVMTLRDDLGRKKSGRVFVDGFCERNGIDLVKIRHINDPDSIQAVRARGVDWLFIIGWSQIASKGLLTAPKRGCLGMHPTLLPQGRGRAAIPWAILKGLKETGVTLFQMDEGVDTGPILARETLPVTDDETATTLYERVANAHKTLMARMWPAIAADAIVLQPQDESQATEWPGRKPEDGVVLPEMRCEYVERLVRAVTRPYPGAFFDWSHDRFRLWSGRAHPGRRDGMAPLVDGNGHLWLVLADGVFEATSWDQEFARK